jgi:hypothetical protein
MFEESPMPKKPKKPVTPVQLSIDATPETARLDHLEMAKLSLMAKDEADQRHAISVKEAVKILGMSQSRLYELLEAGLIGSFLDGKSRKIITHSLYMYQLRLLDQQMDVEAQRMDSLGIGGAENMLKPTRKA